MWENDLHFETITFMINMLFINIVVYSGTCNNNNNKKKQFKLFGVSILKK